MLLKPVLAGAVILATVAAQPAFATPTVIVEITDTVQTTLVSPTFGLYSLAEFFYITEGPGGSSTFDGSLENFPLPEPATLVLLGAGMIGLAGIARLRRRS